jgi:hypothetical protein
MFWFLRLNCKLQNEKQGKSFGLIKKQFKGIMGEGFTDDVK